MHRWTLVALAIAASCAHTDASRGVDGKDRKLVIPQPFPTAQRVEELRKQAPPPASESGAPTRGVAEWTLRGTVPTAPAALAGDPENQALAGAVRNRKDVRVTAGMACFAQQLAAFVIEQEAQPAEDLQDWMAARCGVGLAGSRLFFMRGGQATQKLFDTERDAAIVEQAAAMLGGQGELGLGIASDGTKSAMVVAGGRVQATFEPLAATVDPSGVTIEGQTMWPHEWLVGFVTRGELGFAMCRSAKPTRTGPGVFAISCPVQANDAHATIEISAARKGALLGHALLRFSVSPDGSKPTTWTAPSIPVPAATGERDPVGWLTAINAARQRAGLGEFRLSPGQSEVVGDLLPHFVAHDDDARTRDEIALGMMAGWKVEGTIRDANLRVAAISAELPLDRALGAALASPMYRALLLDKHVDTLAVARSVDAKGNREHVAFVGFELFEPREYLEEESAFMDAIDAERAARGKPPIERVGGAKDRKRFAEAAERVRKGESEPSEEVDGMLAYYAQATGRGFHGGVFTTLVLEGWRPTFSGELVEAQKVAVAVKIADWRPPASAWGQHVIYVIFTVLDE